jgi:hypothetical protein
LPSEEAPDLQALAVTVQRILERIG